MRNAFLGPLDCIAVRLALIFTNNADIMAVYFGNLFLYDPVYGPAVCWNIQCDRHIMYSIAPCDYIDHE